ncbi:response regulator transcription factor [Jidongwangia harbinensis]|uniref:response regulator transcription factor n=1 Tax=Jidongwangia harbinensis TaxID=2878561 RepID=UPI001CD92942|nr:response regulator transcription factor [Jidongwangia harbinensis]MCA2217354.1 response regulator transcription factor [Jidongwangia harbinensis]
MINIMVVADAPLLRSALAMALSCPDDLEVVADVSSVDVTKELLQDLRVDVFIVDLDTLSASVTDAVNVITNLQADPGTVLALTTVAASSAFRHALGCQVRAFLSKECHVDDLLAAVRRVSAGEGFITPEIAVSVMNARTSPLTPRERDVLRLAAEGRSVREIAAALFLTPGTIRTYLSTITHKVGARSRLDAIRIATEANWL